MAIARQELKVKVSGQGHGVMVSKDGNTVGLTSIADKGQFVFQHCSCHSLFT